MTSNHLRYMHSQGLKEQAKSKALIFNLIQLSPFGLFYMKQVNVLDGIKEYYETVPKVENELRDLDDEVMITEDYNDFEKHTKWLNPDSVMDLLETVEMRVEVNNNADFCIILSSK